MADPAPGEYGFTGGGGDYGTFAPRCPSAPDFRPLKIDQHVAMLAGLSDGAAHAAAQMWGNAASLFEATRDNMSSYGDGLRQEWRSRAAEPFFHHVGGTLYSLRLWANAARRNEAALHRLGDAIQTAQDQMSTLYASFKTEVDKIDENGALWADNPFGTDPGPEAMTKMVNEKTAESLKIMDTLASHFTGTPTAVEGKFAGPVDARPPTAAQMARATGGGGGAPAAPGGGGGGGAAPGAPPAAPKMTSQAVLIPGGATYLGPPPAAPVAPPAAPVAPRGPAPAAPVMPSAPVMPPGGLGPQGAPPAAPVIGAAGAVAAPARGAPPAAPVIASAGAPAAGLAGTRGAPPAAPGMPSGAASGSAGAQALRGAPPQAPGSPTSPMSSARSALQGRNAPPQSPGSMPQGSGARGAGARPQIPGRSGGPQGTQGMAPPGGRGVAGRPASPGRGTPGAPGLQGRQAPRAAGGQPGSMGPPNSGSAPRSLQGTRGAPEGARSGRSLNGRAPIRPGTPGSTGTQGLRGRSGPVRAARSETAQTARAALRRGLDGRGIGTGRGPASSGANGPSGRPANAAPAKRHEEKRAAPQMVGDEELFVVEQAAPAVIERKQEKVHAKRPGPALGRG